MRGNKPKLTEKRIADATFTATWEEAKALQRELPRLRDHLRQNHGIGNLQLRFVNPWRGPDQTEFTLFIELTKGATAAAAGALTEWLSHAGRGFLKHYRTAKKRAVANRRQPRAGSGKKQKI